MKKKLSMLTAVMICTFFLCSCGSNRNVKVKVKETPPVDFIEVVHSNSFSSMLTNEDTALSYLFLGEDVLSSSFKNPVYSIDGFDCTLNEELSNIFSSDSDTTPFYVNKNGILYTSTKLKSNSFEETISRVENNELIEVGKKNISLTYGRYVLVKTDEDNKYELLNLDTDEAVEFIGGPLLFFIKPLKDGFLYSYFDDKKYSDFIEATKEDEEMNSPVFDLSKYIFRNTIFFMSYKIYNSEMMNPIDLESPLAINTDSLIELVKSQESNKEDTPVHGYGYGPRWPEDIPITSDASNIVLWIDPNSKTIHMQEVSQVIEKNEAPKVKTFTVEDAPVDKNQTYINQDGSVKWYIIQDSFKEKHLVETTCSFSGIKVTYYILPNYCISPQFLSYDINGNFVIIYWREDLKNYQLGILTNNTKEMIVRNINLPNNIENVQGYSFRHIGDLKVKDETVKDIYWLNLHNPNTDRSNHILRCIIP